jgi:hypothetical protein
VSLKQTTLKPDHFWPKKSVFETVFFTPKLLGFFKSCNLGVKTAIFPWQFTGRSKVKSGPVLISEPFYKFSRSCRSKQNPIWDPNGFKNPGLNNLGQLFPSPLVIPDQWIFFKKHFTARLHLFKKWNFTQRFDGYFEPCHKFVEMPFCERNNLHINLLTTSRWETC